MVKLLKDNLLVEPFEAEQRTSGGIIIPSTAKEKPTRGKILSVGNGTKDEPMELKVGDEVLYSKYSGTEIQLDGVDYVILKQNDVLCVLN